MTLQPVIPGYSPPAEPWHEFTCPHCRLSGRVHYKQRGEHVTTIQISGTISSNRPYLDLQGIPYLVCGWCKHPVDERAGIHQAIMAHMRDV